MRIFFLNTIWIVFSFCVNITNAQVKFNIVAGDQLLYSSDWKDGANHTMSVKAYLEIPIIKKFKDFKVVLSGRNQKDKLYYNYISYEHENTRTTFLDYYYYEHGILEDVKFTMNKYLLGINLQHRIIKELYLSLGYGVSINKYDDLQGESTSSLHYYNINLAGNKVFSNYNGYYSFNLQYKFQILPKVNMILASEFVKHQKINISDLNIYGLRQYAFHFDIGVGYSF